MKILVAVVFVLVIGAVVGYALVRGRSSGVMARPSAAVQAPMPIEDQLAALETCGIRLAPGRTVDDLLISFDRADYEARPFELLLHMMGSEVEAEPWGRRFSDDVWLCDLECIEGDGSYVAIVENLRRIAGDDFPASEITDQIDHERGNARLSFRLAGELVTIEPEYREDWADPRVFARLTELVRRRGTGRTFFVADTGGGQQTLIGFGTEEQREHLASVTGRRVVWMDQ